MNKHNNNKKISKSAISNHNNNNNKTTRFTMDLRYPLSPLQAFAICVACLDGNNYNNNNYYHSNFNIFSNTNKIKTTSITIFITIKWSIITTTSNKKYNKQITTKTTGKIADRKGYEYLRKITGAMSSSDSKTTTTAGESQEQVFVVVVVVVVVFFI